MSSRLTPRFFKIRWLSVDFSSKDSSWWIGEVSEDSSKHAHVLVNGFQDSSSRILQLSQFPHESVQRFIEILIIAHFRCFQSPKFPSGPPAVSARLSSKGSYFKGVLLEGDYWLVPFRYLYHRRGDSSSSSNSSNNNRNNNNNNISNN